MSESDEAHSAFKFLTELTAKLSAGNVELPSFPTVVTKIRQLYKDGNCFDQRVADLIAAEPVRAARLLQMGNSSAINGSGRRGASSARDESRPQ